MKKVNMDTSKPLRRILAAALTIVMTLALTVPAFALEAGDTCPPGCETCAKFLADHGYKSQSDAVPTVTSFSDVPENHTFHDAILWCAGQGIVSGYSDGTFRPANTVTRANFAVMLARAFYPDELARYTTDSNLRYGYATPGFLALNSKGLLKNTNFDTMEKFITASVVNAGISRYDMAQLMTNIMNEKGFAATASQKSAVISEIKDYSEIPSQYRDAVTNVYALGIIGGFSNGTFGGSGTMNRGQGAVVIYRMMQKSTGNITNPGTDPEAPVDPDTGSQSCLCKSIYGYCPCVGEKAPDSGDNGNTTPETPSTPSQTTKTLVDGSAITEANVMRLMEARIAEWGNQKWGSVSNPSYPQGNSGDVCRTVWTYRGYGTDSYVSCTSGCGGWATYLSDAAFGSTGFPMRKVTSVDDIRAGDIVIYLTDGKIAHVDIVSGKTNTRDFGSYTITYYGCYSANAGTVPGHSPNEINPTSPIVTTNYDSNTGNSCVIYTRYPN